MCSEDPIDRLQAEYLQAKIRVKSLKDFLEKYKDGIVSLPPYTNYNILNRQFQTMLVYEKILEDRLNLIKEEKNMDIDFRLQEAKDIVIK